jgi:hypothetical protein
MALRAASGGIDELIRPARSLVRQEILQIVY